MFSIFSDCFLSKKSFSYFSFESFFLELISCWVDSANFSMISGFVYYLFALSLYPSTFVAAWLEFVILDRFFKKLTVNFTKLFKPYLKNHNFSYSSNFLLIVAHFLWRKANIPHFSIAFLIISSTRISILFPLLLGLSLVRIKLICDSRTCSAGIYNRLQV